MIKRIFIRSSFADKGKQRFLVHLTRLFKPLSNAVPKEEKEERKRRMNFPQDERLQTLIV